MSGIPNEAFSATVTIESDGRYLRGIRVGKGGLRERYSGTINRNGVQLDGTGSRDSGIAWRFAFAGPFRPAVTVLSGQMYEADRAGIEHADRDCRMALAL